MQMNEPVDLKPFFLTLDDLEEFVASDGFVDWSAIFGNDHPVEIDVGCGRGLFLVTAGMANPHVNYLGIECDYREGRRTAARLKNNDLTNVRVWGGKVQHAFEKFVRPGTVSAVHVYFPDPWWKRRHRERRVFTEQLVDQMVTVLQPDRLVHSWSDVEEYFQVISGLMERDVRFNTLPAPEERAAEHDMDYQTSFERKKRKEGFPIYRGEWQLISKPLIAKPPVC